MSIFDESLKKHGYKPEQILLVPKKGGGFIHLTVWKPPEHPEDLIEKKKKAAGGDNE